MKSFHITFTQLEMLVAIVDAGSFSEAALQIHMTQSALSHAMSKLESQLGVQLLLRSRKGLSLTPIGLDVLSIARETLTQVRQIETLAEQEQNLLRGRLRMGHVHPLNSVLMAGVLNQFYKQFPDVDLQLYEAGADELPEWLRLGIVDLGLVLHPTEGLETEFLVHDELILLLLPTHPLAQRASVPLSALATEHLLLPLTQQEFVRGLFGSTAPLAAQIIPVTDLRTILLMAQEGMGVSLYPRSGLTEHLQGLKVMSLDPPQYVQFGLGFAAGSKPSLLANKFKQVANYWVHTQGAFLRNS
ncbi:MAG: LysR family transcriptional regulator [Candidatus Sericytochromatia bacterium]